MSTQPGEIPCCPLRVHSPKCSRRTATGRFGTRSLSRRQKLTLSLETKTSSDPARRSEYAAIASKCQWSWVGWSSMHPTSRRSTARSRFRWNAPSSLVSRCNTWTAGSCRRTHSEPPRGRTSSGPGPRLASDAENLSLRCCPNSSICRFPAPRLRTFGSSSAGPPTPDGEAEGDPGSVAGTDTVGDDGVPLVRLPIAVTGTERRDREERDRDDCSHPHGSGRSLHPLTVPAAGRPRAVTAQVRLVRSVD